MSVTSPQSESDRSDGCSEGEPLVMHARVVSGFGGGPDKTILNSPRYLKRLGYRSVCVYLRDPNDAGFEVLVERAIARAAPLEAVDDLGAFDFKVVRHLRRVVEQYRPTIWHGHDYKSNLLGLWLSRHYPMRLVTTVHGWVQRTWKTPLYYFIDRRCLPRYEKVICVSQDLFADCQRLGVQAEDLTLIDNAIALDDYEFELSASDAKQKLGFAPHTFTVAGVGRLSDEKAFDRLIDAIGSLIDEGRDISLVIAGDGAERERLQRLIEGTGHAERMKLLGFVGDPREVYRAADLFTLSSLREGLPNVVLEAMAMRVPVLATTIAGMPDLIDHGRNGWLIEPGNTDALRTSIRAAMDDPQVRHRMAEQGRLTIEERFNFEHRMHRIAEVYRQLDLKV